MTLSYFTILTLSYAAALAGWWGVYTLFSRTFQAAPESEINKPWRETAYVLGAAVATILIGRLYSAGYLLPEFTVANVRLSECINQLLIYSPFAKYLIRDLRSLASIWIQSTTWGLRVIIGVALGLVAIFVFVLLANAEPFIEVVLNVFNGKNLHHAVQIFLEDLAICLLLSRLARAFGQRYFLGAVVLVALLFSFGHLPGMLEAGVPLGQAFWPLCRDAALVAAVCVSIYRARDMLWFWPVHFAMDMMQFYSGLPLD